jgi:hypothetical protein
MIGRPDYGVDFVADDVEFLRMHADVKTADPLSVRHDDSLAPFQQNRMRPDFSATENMLDRYLDWSQSSTDATQVDIIAAQRDIDKVFGGFLANRANIFEFHPTAITVADDLMAKTGNPRPNLYGYSIGNTPELSGTYTGDEREVQLIDILDASVTAAHYSLHSLLKARTALRNGEGDAAAGSLNTTLEHLDASHRSMLRAYREVGGPFVANQQNRYVVGLKHRGTEYEGPNPSHSVFLAVDRFALGSLESLQVNPALKKHLEHRQSDMPAHLRRLTAEADEAGDNESIRELSDRYFPPASEVATEIIQLIRKFKVAHRSYADRALEAKGKTLSETDTDLLAPGIALARSKE